jgi:hypothetical protein
VRLAKATLIDEPPADTQSAPLWIDQEAPKLGDVRIVRVANDEDASDSLAIQLRDPEPFARGIVLCGEAREERCDECFELLIEAEFRRVQLPVGCDCPADITGALVSNDGDGRFRWVRLQQQLLDARDRGYQALLAGSAKPPENLGRAFL